MSLTLELPPPINEELVQESEREGVSEQEHALLLLCLATAFQQEEPLTPFQKAVRVFLSRHDLDAQRVFSVFEELVRVCMNLHDAGKSTNTFQASLANANMHRDDELLKQWRNTIVHQASMDHPHNASPDLLSPLPPSEKTVDDPRERVRALLAKLQAEDNTPTLPPIPTRPDETPTQALFRKWEEEEALLSDEEKEADEKLWEEFQQGIDAERTKAGMRTLF